jgi:phospholipid/cholesterol/gamma-HCH transport system substrate-binding protein
MDIKENRRAIIVGIFLAIGVVIFVVGIFTLGGQQKSFEKSIYVSSVFDDVAGLKSGNDIWFSGVKVGTIHDVRFVGISEVNVVMRIDDKSRKYIHTDAMTKIGSDGLIGNKIVVIEGGSDNAPVVSNGTVLKVEKTTSTDEMLQTLQKNNENLVAITSDFKTVVHQMAAGKGAIGTLISDSNLADQLKASMRNLQVATSSAAQTVSQLNKFTSTLNTKGGLADQLLTDTTVFNRLKRSAAGLQQAVTNANELVQNLNKASSKLNTTDNAIGILLNDPKAAVKVQSTLDNLQQSSIKLNQDLEAAQHNFLLKGFFKKQEKAKEDSLKAKGM